MRRESFFRARHKNVRNVVEFVMQMQHEKCCFVSKKQDLLGNYYYISRWTECNIMKHTHKHTPVRVLCVYSKLKLLQSKKKKVEANRDQFNLIANT